jgi:cytoskeletal protein RodZ
MNNHYLQVIFILLLTIGLAISVQSQDSNQENRTIAEDALANSTENSSLNLSVPNFTSTNDTALNNTTQNITAQNLSTLNGEIPTAVFISEIADTAPLVAATASSAQASFQPEESVLLGPEMGGLDPFNPKHVEIEPTEIGLPIKPLRNTSDMVFVCDIV